MSRLNSAPRPARLTPVAALAALIAAGALAAAALAATAFTLKVFRHATVTNQAAAKTTHANVVTNSKGMVVYTLTGDSRTHAQCTSSTCLKFWPPVTVKSVKRLTRAAGVKGKLGTWKHKGFIQVTIDGHPLYTFFADRRRGVATGEGLRSFGGTWHVRLAAGGGTVKAPAAAPPPSSGSGW